MLINYFAIFGFFALVFFAGIGVIIVALLVNPRKKTTAKLAAYECGVPAFNNARVQFNVRYYLLAIVFIIFDIELIFLFPWAIVAKQLAWSGIIAMGIFLLLLAIGLIYEWQKGALEWD